MKKLLTVTIGSGLLTISKMAGGLIVSKLVAMYVGPAGLAMMGQIQSIVGSLNGIVGAPGGNALVRYTAQNKAIGVEHCAPWWSASFRWGLWLLLLTVLCTLIGAEAISKYLFETTEYVWVILLIIASLPFSMSNTYISSVLNGLEEYKWYISIGILSSVTTTLIMILLIFFYGLNGALTGTAISAGVAGIIAAALSFRTPWLDIKNWLAPTTATNKKGVGSYVLMAVATSVITPVTLIIIRKILVAVVGWEGVGYWQAVYKISEVYLGLITVSLSTYYLPKLSSIENKEDINSEIRKVAQIVVPTVLIISFFVYLLRQLIITNLFSNEFSAAADLFAVQLLGDVIKVAAWIYAYPMLSSGAARWFVITEIGFAACFIASTYLFVTVFGLQGVVLGYALSYMAYFLVVYFNKKNYI